MITLIKGEIAQTTVSRGAEGAEKYTRMLRDGTLAFADFMLVAELEGLVKVANTGVAVTGITCAGAYDADGEDFSLNVPVGTTIMVIRVEVVIGLMTDDEDLEILFMTSNTPCIGITGGSAVVPVNKFGGVNGPGTGSNCACYVGMNAAGGTDVSGGARAYTFWRTRQECGAKPAAAQSEGTTKTSHQWASPADGLPAIVAGGGCVAGHVMSTTANTATHISVEWIELPTAWLV